MSGKPRMGEAGTRERLRSRRKRAVRAKTISVKRLPKSELELGRALQPPVEDAQRPVVRRDCQEGPRPCPFVSCKHHLYLDVAPRTGGIKLNFPDLEPWELEETCVLDVADRGGVALEEVGSLVNLTRERIRQLEVNALAKLQAVRLTIFDGDADDESTEPPQAGRRKDESTEPPQAGRRKSESTEPPQAGRRKDDQ